MLRKDYDCKRSLEKEVGGRELQGLVAKKN
jgi:hypothetical protein